MRLPIGEASVCWFLAGPGRLAGMLAFEACKMNFRSPISSGSLSLAGICAATDGLVSSTIMLTGSQCGHAPVELP
jgi:hypothetical protein